MYEVTKEKTKPLETIMVAGEEVPIEGTGVETYKVVIDGKEEISTLWHFERCVEYWEKQKAEHIAKCDAEIEKCNAVIIEISKLDSIIEK